jgi:hypothetical protein
VHHPWHSCGLSTLQHRAQFAAERATYSINCTFVVSMYCRILLVSVGGLMSYMVPGVVCELTRDGLSSDRRDVRDGSQLCAFMKILAVLFTTRARRAVDTPTATPTYRAELAARHTTANTQRAQATVHRAAAAHRTAAGTWDLRRTWRARGTGQRAPEAERRRGARRDGTRTRCARERTRRGQPGAGPSCILDSAAWSCHAGPAALVRTELGAGAWVTTFVASCADARSPPYWPPRWSPPLGARP